MNRPCQLCRKDTNPLRKAHIFPIGFFNNIQDPITGELSKGQGKSIRLDGGESRRLAKGIYDPDILCDLCEHLILQPLDDYAIKILRDKESAIRVPIPSYDSARIWLFKNVNKRDIRAFIASVLWRCSVSQQLELKNICIGDVYEERIRQDLLNGGEFTYVDAWTVFMTDPLHSAFILPCRRKLLPLNSSRSLQSVNGWTLQFPNISMTVSLDKRPHPHNSFYSIPVSHSGLPNICNVSTSLNAASHFVFSAFESDHKDGIREKTAQALIAIENRGSSFTVQSPIETGQRYG